MKKFVFSLIFLSQAYWTMSQKVGIGTTTPHYSAVLHVDVADNSSGGFLVSGNFDFGAASSIPNLGVGPRLMFYPARKSFRAGFVDGNQWDNFYTGEFSAALGRSVIASGYAAMAFGENSIAAGDNSTAFGRNSKALGFYSTAMGYTTRASGDYSTAQGAFTVASGEAATALGYYTLAKGYASTVVGMFNDSILQADQITRNDFTPLFIVGNGSGLADRRNAMTVFATGKIGVGTNNPGALLHLRSASLNISNPQLLLEETSANSYARVAFKNAATANPWLISAIPTASNSTSKLTFYWAGLGTDVLTLYGDGTAKLAGNITVTSDSRLKKDIVPLAGAADAIEKLNGYSYYWKDTARDAKQQVGLLAQEVQQVYPQLVQTDEHGMLSVNYMGMVPVLLNALKEQQQTIRSQEMTAGVQQTKIAQLEERLALLEKKMLK